MRYVGQTYEVDVPVPAGSLDSATITRLLETFHERHEQEYGIASDQFPVTFVNLRAVGRKQTVEHEFRSPSTTASGGDVTDTREVYFDGEWQTTSIYYRDGLEPASELEGPAIIEDAHSTITLNPGMNAAVDDHENIVITTK
ncbi:hydantoinase/oxoprolinase family protein [Halovalidus salilacus]